MTAKGSTGIETILSTLEVQIFIFEFIMYQWAQFLDQLNSHSLFLHSETFLITIFFLLGIDQEVCFHKRSLFS